MSAPGLPQPTAEPAAATSRVLRIAMAVYGDLSYDSRVQREATSLASAGYRVAVACLACSPAAAAALAPVEVLIVKPTRDDVLPTGDGPFLVGSVGGREGGPSRLARMAAPLGRAVARLRWLAGYRATLLDWGRAVVDAAGPVDRWHLHDLTGLLAVDAAIPHAVPRVYDAHELFIDTGSAARMPWVARRLIVRLERHLAGRCAAVITVNPGLAAVLRRRLRRDDVAIVRNCLPRVAPPPDPRPRPLHDRLGLPSSTPLILFHGNLGEERGIERIVGLLEAGRLGDAHFVCLGNGALADWLRERAASGPAAGRLHALPAVPPAELPPLVASADVGAVLQMPFDLNLRLSTPNKLWECLAVGTPVVASDFPEIRRVVAGFPEGPLGALCDPQDDEAIAAALTGLLADPDALGAARERCRRAAAERWNWEAEGTTLVAVHRGLDRA
ncbi:MAG: glycosyltransferase [Candidatus Limnocylindrales bacterium]